MNPEPPFQTYHLAGGLRATVSDATRHYYGGYFHVSLRVRADIPLLAAWFASPSLYEDACARLGSSIRFYRTLEKMAVPGDEVDRVRQNLLQSFESNLIPYLVRPDFPSRFAVSEYWEVAQNVSHPDR